MSKRTMLRPTAPLPSSLLNLNTHNMASKIHPKRARPSTITSDQNVEAIERIVMPDRQIPVHRVAYELSIPTITAYEIMSNHLSIKKVSTRWVRKLLTPIPRANSVDCCQELLQESEVNPDNYFQCIVTRDKIWV